MLFRSAGVSLSDARASGSGLTVASATSRGLDAADTSAYALASGASGTTTARSVVASGTSTIDLSAVADVKSTTASQTSASYDPATGLNFPNLSGGSNGLQAFSFANGAPNALQLNGLLASHPNVAAAVGSGVVIGLGSLGANYGGSGGTRSYTANALYSFNLSTSASLTLGLLNMTAYNGGFDTLNFTVKRGGTTLFNDSFTTLAAAQAYFTDQAKTLTGFTAGTNEFYLKQWLRKNGIDLNRVTFAGSIGTQPRQYSVKLTDTDVPTFFGR